MIGEAELRRRAAHWNVDPMVVDLDYSLGWFIAALYKANRDANRYDIHRLVQTGVEPADVIPLLPAKFEARGLDIATVDVQRIVARRSDFEDDWHRRLSYLVRGELAVDFETAWGTTIEVLQRVEKHLAQQP